MNVEIDFKTFTELAKQKRPVAISTIIQVDQFTPVAIFEKFYNYFDEGLLAEITHENTSQILMGFNPRGFFQVKNQIYKVCLDGETYSFNDDVLDALRKFKKMAAVESVQAPSGLVGGIFGLVSYEAVRLFEKKLNKSNAKDETPDFLFYCYKINLIFDKESHTLTLAVTTPIGGNLQQSYQTTICFLQQLIHILNAPLPRTTLDQTAQSNHDSSVVSVDLTDHDHQCLVEKAKAYIQQGDIFQVTLSRSFTQPIQTSSFELYRTLRLVTPAPYLFYLDNGERVILGASPEKLVSVQNSRVETVPIAGTCKDAGEGSVHKLLNDEKELAEHMMLVDLSRNDLGKVCKVGSVKAEALLSPKKAGNLIHLTTHVSGELDEPFDALDVLKAVFPAGTVSGAPKFRAMEIIEQLEESPRGFYAGAVCFIDSLGNMDSAIVIRTMVLKDGIATVKAGSGIVWDSIPERESQECRDKASTILKAIKIAKEKTHVTYY